MTTLEPVKVDVSDVRLAMLKQHMKECHNCRHCSVCLWQRCIPGMAIVELLLTEGKANAPR